MAEVHENKAAANKQDDNKIRQFIDGLDDKHKMLVVLKAQLYGNRWEPMLDDLRNRLEGKPYIFKLANRIKDDIERIDRLRNFETQNNVDLSVFIKIS